jgi:hypothetical protein
MLLSTIPRVEEYQKKNGAVLKWLRAILEILAISDPEYPISIWIIPTSEERHLLSWKICWRHRLNHQLMPSCLVWQTGNAGCCW